MLLNNYGRLPIPYQIVRDLLRTHWNEDFIPLPVIIERPLPEYNRADLFNQGAHLVISTEDVIEQLIHIGFRNLDIQVPMNIEILTAGRPQELGNTKDRESDWERHQLVFHYAREIQRIILATQHDPNLYLLTSCEESGALEKWTVSGGNISLVTDIKGLGTYGLRVENDTSSEISLSINLPTDEDDNFPLIPRPGERLRALKFFAGTDSTGAGRNMDIQLVSGNTTVDIATIVLLDKGVNNELPDYFIHMDDPIFVTAIDTIKRASDLALTFVIPADTTVWLDHVVFSTCEYQMLLYQQFQEDLDDYQFHSGIIRATFRSVGDPVDTL